MEPSGVMEEGKLRGSDQSVWQTPDDNVTVLQWGKDFLMQQFCSKEMIGARA